MYPVAVQRGRFVGVYRSHGQQALSGFDPKRMVCVSEDNRQEVEDLTNDER